MKLHLLLALSTLPASPLLAQQSAAPAEPNTTATPEGPRSPTSAELRKQLVETLKTEIEEAKKNPASPPYAFDAFLQALEAVSTESIARGTVDTNSFLQFLPVQGYQKTKELTSAYQKQLRAEIFATQAEEEKKLAARIGNAMREALKSKDPKKIEELEREMEILRREMSQNESIRPNRIRGNSFTSDIAVAINFIRIATYFRSSNLSNNLSGSLSNLRQLREILPQLNRYLPVQEELAVLAEAERSLGILPPDQARKLFDSLVEQLFDDRNQDRLDDIMAQIRRQQTLSNNTEQSLGPKWQSLANITELFRREVLRVKNGQASRFSAEQWGQDSSGAVQILSEKDLQNRLFRYQVEIKRPDGSTLKVPMSYDLPGIAARIQNLEDLERQLPTLRRAVYQRNSNGDAGSWQWALSQLSAISDLHALLKSGDSFPISLTRPSEYNTQDRYNTLGSTESEFEWVMKLRIQANSMILQRFHPEWKMEEGASPDEAVERLFKAALKQQKYADLIALNQLAAFFNPGKTLLSPQDGIALHYFLNGVKQQEQLQQPRLAVMYFQRAAAIDSQRIPAGVLRERLLQLKSKFREDYEKGTDDALKPAVEAMSYGMQGTLTVPGMPGRDGD